MDPLFLGAGALGFFLLGWGVGWNQRGVSDTDRCSAWNEGWLNGYKWAAMNQQQGAGDPKAVAELERMWRL